MAVRFHPAAAYVAGAIFTIPLDLSADVDLTSTSGPTNGFSARALLVGATAGNIKFKDILGNIKTQAVTSYQRLDSAVQFVYSTANGSTAATVTALG
jgi:hypothetical protein